MEKLRAKIITETIAMYGYYCCASVKESLNFKIYKVDVIANAGDYGGDSRADFLYLRRDWSAFRKKRGFDQGRQLV